MQENNISANNFEQCVKCSICVSACPMMEVNPDYPGPKQAGPDGERYRLKDPSFYDLTLRYCLNCKRCEVACPSGVRIGDIIQTARLKYGRKSHPLRDRMMADTDFAGRLATNIAPLVNRLGTSGLVRLPLHAIGGIDRHRTLPRYSGETFEEWFAGQDQSGFDRYVTYFHGCYVNYNNPGLGKDLVRILNACGYGVRLLDGENCCGAAMITAGFGKKAWKLARSNVAAIMNAVGEGAVVLTTGSTCTFILRDEYENLLGIDASGLRDSVFLATKWLFERVEAGDVRLVFREDYNRRITYHTACHMQKLGWAIFSTSLLESIPGVSLTVPEQHCCGMAGTFGFKKENYDFSMKIGNILFDSLRESRPDIVATDCETCKWQIEEGANLTVMNPVSVLAGALDFERTKELNNGK